jgi:hypothetical protein
MKWRVGIHCCGAAPLDALLEFGESWKFGADKIRATRDIQTPCSLQ